MKNLIVSPSITIKQALKAMNKGGEKCLVVVDEEKILLGTLSDGDLRRAILSRSNIDSTIKNIYNKNSTSFIEGGFTSEQAKRSFLDEKYDIIPIVDRDSKLVDVLLWEKVFKNGEKKQLEPLNVPVVIMAGGKGSRLEPFTKVMPKPLIPINDKPIIEHIIENFTVVGMNEFYLTVNYKSRILKAFFEELKPEYDYSFIDEQEPLGTAGGLHYLKGKFKSPFVLTNCDIIINADYVDLYNFHVKNSYSITLVASAKEYIIPYGTCELNEIGHLDRLREKPQYNFLVNTGLYIINPEMLELIPENKLYNITHLIKDAQKQGVKVGVYPISEDAWIDVGQWEEYRKIAGKII